MTFSPKTALALAEQLERVATDTPVGSYLTLAAECARALRDACDLIERQSRHITILVMDRRRQLPEDVLKDIADSHTDRDRARAECEAMRLRVSELEAFMDVAQAAIVSECVDHVELNGHIDIAKECCDYLDHEAMDSGDPSGKLRDFVTSLSIIVQQFDKQRRRANWHEAGYKAGKQKVVDSAVEKATAELRAERDAARADVSNIREALAHLLDALADQGAPTWERSLERACILTGRYCEPYKDMRNPNALAAEVERMRPVYNAVGAYVRAARSKANLAPVLYNELAAPFDAAELAVAPDSAVRASPDCETPFCTNWNPCEPCENHAPKAGKP